MTAPDRDGHDYDIAIHRWHESMEGTFTHDNLGEATPSYYTPGVDDSRVDRQIRGGSPHQEPWYASPATGPHLSGYRPPAEAAAQPLVNSPGRRFPSTRRAPGFQASFHRRPGWHDLQQLGDNT